MTHKVPKSAMGPHFAVAAASHALEMKNWRAHMARVAADEKAGVIGIEKHAPYPRPTHHPLVEAAVNENDEVDYVVEDDGPTPAQILEAQKAKLIADVGSAERAAIEAVVPLGKQRSFNIRENDIRVADAKFAPPKRSLLEAAKTSVGLAPKVDITAEIEKARPPADTQFLADQQARRTKVEMILRAGAVMLSEIDDLTAETIDAWKMPDFPK